MQITLESQFLVSANTVPLNLSTHQSCGHNKFNFFSQLLTSSNRG